MAVTANYLWDIVGDTFHNVVTDGVQDQPAAASSGNDYLAVWRTPAGLHQDIQGRFAAADGVPWSGEFPVSTTTQDGKWSPSAAGLNDGKFVVAFRDVNASDFGSIYFRLFKMDGSKEAGDVVIENHSAVPTIDSEPDVSALPQLSDGGFVVTWTRDYGGGDRDIEAAIYNADGSARTAEFEVNRNGNNTEHASVAGLTGGGFVVAWQESPAAGGDSEVRFRLFNADGSGVPGASDSTGVLIDTLGTINENIQVAALPDGGFVVAYEDNGWSGDRDITARVYNADGSPRSSYIHVNTNFAATDGDQTTPQIAVLSNGYFVVGYLNSTNQYGSLFDSSGTRLGDDTFLANGVKDFAFASLEGGRFALVEQSSVSDGSGDSIRSYVREIVRKTAGDGADNTLTGDGLHDRIHAGGGKDTIVGSRGPDELFGEGGDDTFRFLVSALPEEGTTIDGGTGTDTIELMGGVSDFTAVTLTSVEALHYANAAQATFASSQVGGGGITSVTGSAGVDRFSVKGADTDLSDVSFQNWGGNDRIFLVGTNGDDTLRGSARNDDFIGAQGDDTVVFAYDAASYVAQQFGKVITVSGPEGNDTLSGIEHLKFKDGVITVDTGNTLIDNVYYLTHNPDVFHSGMSAAEHFNTFGWHEGRNPNAFFDVKGYLAANPDVAASGMNPLDHYHQIGWQQGRDPGANFDTKLYLLHNPDVAAAGIDPLVHYLQTGFYEGRATYQAIGDKLVGGFDAEYYLFHNPDVAASGVDPLAHFNTFGWHEGRNPNAVFDTAGYLSHYADVAASGVNPLEHYEQFGWKEGRDPSAAFDTAGYLAANPDVAAAGVNPLDHFLQNGIYEGRTAVNDGLWH